MTPKSNRFNNQACKVEGCEGHLRWLVETLSPVIFGQKPAEIISYPKYDCLRCEKLDQMEHHLENSMHLSYRKIIQDNDQIKVLFYHEEALKEVLLDPRVRRFLATMGYPMEETMEAWLDRLCGQIAVGKCPDEIGVFLGYPLKDVLGFMGHPSLPLTKVQYWRVYGDSRESDKKFQAIMESRSVMQCILSEDGLDCILQAI